MSAAWPLVGHSEAETAFLTAFEGGTLHHGWLVEGPLGIGKATLAKRLAGALLGAAGPDATVDDPVVQKLLASAHPDLRWIHRRPDEKGKRPQDIPVDDIRDLNAFFALRPALGGWRVGVIDSLDELNRFGANALLKTLEEPPPKSVLFLISHRGRQVLPTIRSRCRTLRLSPLSATDTDQVLAAQAGDRDIAAVRDLFPGQPGQILRLSTPSAASAANAAETLLRSLPRPGAAAVSGFIRFGGADEDAFEALAAKSLAWIAAKAEADPRYAKAYLDLAALSAETSNLAMSRAQAAAKLVEGLQKAAQAR